MDRLRKVIEVAKMYYQLDYSQHEIAKRFNISRPTVSRLLQQAKSEGIVQITIKDPDEENKVKAEALKDAFGLSHVIVTSIPQFEHSIALKYLGEATADYLHQLIKDHDTIAMTWGTTLYSVAKNLRQKHVVGVKVVQLNGGVSHSETNTYASEILHLFGKAYNTSPYFLPLPAVVDHVMVKQTIESDRHISKVLDLGREANVAVFTVGAPGPDSLLVRTKYFTDEDLEIINAHAVGDICSRYINFHGQICSPALDRRTIGISLDELKKKQHSILIAGGPKKVEAIYGALQGKYANTLITDNFTSELLLERHRLLEVEA